jgi:PrcB C-terminal
MKIFMRAIAVLSLLILPMQLSAEVDTKPITFQVYVPNENFSTDSSGLDRKTLKTINSDREWQQLWREIEPRMSRDEAMRTPHPKPAIDFSRYMLVVIALGSKPSSGYGIVLHSITEYPSHVDVSAVELHPEGADCIVLTVLTRPVALALIPRTEKEVRIHLSKAALRCGE